MTIPGEVLDSIKETLENVDEVESNLLDFLAAAAADPDALADLPPLQRARAFLVLAQAATTLLSVRLRCNGIRPDDHPIRTEIEIEADPLLAAENGTILVGDNASQSAQLWRSDKDLLA